MSDMHKSMTPGRRKGCPNYSPEFKQQLVAASCKPGVSISKLALGNGMYGTLRLNGAVSEGLLTILIQELKR